MKLISFKTKTEGTCYPHAWASLGQVKDTNGRGVYFNLCLPFPTKEVYEDFDNLGLYEGLRTTKIGVHIRRNKQGKWSIWTNKWRECVEKPTLVVTTEALQDMKKSNI